MTSLLGAAAAIAVVYYGGIKGVKNPVMFLDTHAIILVVGGTLAATFLAFPYKQLTQLFDFIIFGVFSSKKTDYLKLVDELSEINQCYQNKNQQARTKEYSHYFLREGVNLLFEPALTHEDLEEVLDLRVQAFKKRYQQDAKTLNAIAKYPPAFGLLGATTGMIAMMTNLGGPGGTSAIGQAMAVALVATFWGIATANFVFLPLSDNAQKACTSDEFTRNFIKEGILLIHRNTQPKVFIERLTSMLPLEERIEAKSQHASAYNIVPSNIVQMFTAKPSVSLKRPVKKETASANVNPADQATIVAEPMATGANSEQDAEYGPGELSFRNVQVKKKAK
ncbi:MAG: hypothetical protein K0R29_1919 [Pseudobdellovibrio sp.]|nr:hypothetical protein [Pseudobdellovibrio sp.]